MNGMAKSPIGFEQKEILWGFGIIAAVLIGAGAYGYIQLGTLSARVDTLSARVDLLATTTASTTLALQAQISQAQSSLSTTIFQNVGAIQQQIGGVTSQVGNLSGTLGTIQKLSQIDPELLKKYSKVYFLNENYVPANLSEIPTTFQYTDKPQLLYLAQALPHLESMILAASSTGVLMYVDSAYRSFDEQKALKGDYKMTFGAGTANSFSADQGYSEHQLGTAVDLIAPHQGGQLDGFDKTPAYQWLLQNAYRYGFVLSYPDGNGYYVFEPWHWRFVGIKLATDLHNEGKNFYDLDQRTIDSYLVNIFDN